MPHNGELRPTIGGDRFTSLGHPIANFNGFLVLAVLLHGSQVLSISQTLRHEQRASPMFGRATITLGIGPHSSYHVFRTAEVGILSLMCRLVMARTHDRLPANGAVYRVT